ncbi:MAG: hypothetical protein EZS28_038572 [Streblomastix strix]|uniref:Pre-mRNA polyadenylation factor Fip1 domain-containing protein n=1 Tax=Streblomastix strix TaxID=222440 RepID=A0A5J4U7Q0_9EUKA|nr:MAG: hypothetical protein EZS28_038572 [Streblomastix strix]
MFFPILPGVEAITDRQPPTYNGVPIYDVDIESTGRPWTQPGEDIGDYFNYGFTEETWLMYCAEIRQNKPPKQNDQGFSFSLPDSNEINDIKTETLSVENMDSELQSHTNKKTHDEIDKQDRIIQQFTSTAPLMQPPQMKSNIQIQITPPQTSSSFTFGSSSLQQPIIPPQVITTPLLQQDPIQTQQITIHPQIITQSAHNINTSPDDKNPTSRSQQSQQSIPSSDQRPPPSSSSHHHEHQHESRHESSHKTSSSHLSHTSSHRHDRGHDKDKDKDKDRKKK